jgi:hypothetical protein
VTTMEHLVEELASPLDGAQLLRAATVAAKACIRNHGLLNAIDVDDIAGEALRSYFEADPAKLARYTDAAQFVVGAAKNIALRMVAERKRENVAAQRDDEGQTLIDFASHALEDGDSAEDILGEAIDRNREASTSAGYGSRSKQCDPGAAVRVTPEGRKILSERWGLLAKTLVHGQPTPMLIAWIYGNRKQRKPSLELWCRGLLRIAAEHEVSDDAAVLRVVPQSEMDKLVRRAASRLSNWFHSHFPRRGACPECGPSVFVFDCREHTIRTLLSVEGARSQQERRGQTGHRSWGGWRAPEGDSLVAQHRAACQEYLVCRGRLDRLRGRLKRMGLLPRLADSSRAFKFTSAAANDMARLERELDGKYERRWIHGDREDLQQHRMNLVVRAFRIELCRALALQVTDLDEHLRLERLESARRTDRVMAEMKAAGEWPTRDRRKGGRPRKLTTRTRRRRP